MIRGSVSTVQLVIGCPKRTLHTSPHRVRGGRPKLGAMTPRLILKLLPRKQGQEMRLKPLAASMPNSQALSSLRKHTRIYGLSINSYKHLPQIQVSSNFLKLWGNKISLSYTGQAQNRQRKLSNVGKAYILFLESS